MADYLNIKEYWAKTYWGGAYWGGILYGPTALVFITPECRTILAESVHEPMSDRNMRISAQSFAQQQCSRVYVIKKEQ